MSSLAKSGLDFCGSISTPARALIIFNLCFWEHFALGGGFSAILSVLFGGIGLYYIAKGRNPAGIGESTLLIGLVFLVASVLSLGAGYAATAAALALLALVGLQKLAASRRCRGIERLFAA